MEEENRPTLEEMVDAYRRYASVMDRNLVREGAERATLAGPPSFRHTALAGWLQTAAAVAASVFVIFFVLPPATAQGTNLTADWQSETEAITQILKAV